jgi:hypothetical protein
MTGRILSLERDRRICIVDLVYFSPDRAVLGPMTLTVEVACVQGGSEMTIRQEGYQDGPDWNWYYEAVCAAWPKWPSPSNATQRIVDEPQQTSSKRRSHNYSIKLIWDHSIS